MDKIFGPLKLLNDLRLILLVLFIFIGLVLLGISGFMIFRLVKNKKKVSN